MLILIGEELWLGPGVITGPEFQKLSDESLTERLPQLHEFGRMTPEDKLRLVSVMQERGEIVAIMGDAVNDAAALGKADVDVPTVRPYQGSRTTETTFVRTKKVLSTCILKMG